jgi:hypothetical protein
MNGMEFTQNGQMGTNNGQMNPMGIHNGHHPGHRHGHENRGRKHNGSSKVEYDCGMFVLIAAVFLLSY